MLCLPELLSPAGDENALRAAVDCGADAVYLGAKAFGARASAVNFDDDTLARAVEYAHLYHTRVYVTVNTLVKEGEYPRVERTLAEIRDAGADAVIVQDLGVAKLAAEKFPDLALHASTQMALSNASDASFARKLGFSRVVLARECTIEEIRKVVDSGVETEVFAHGALCTAVSGRCLMSSMAGGRSGNRGRCAQPCRMELTWNGKNAAWLSLKDLCTIQHLPDFCDAGVTSLKLEGRLKSPEYVAVVTGIYRKALDDIRAGRFDPEDTRPLEQLRQIFNRGGFTRGHAFHAEDADLCATKRVAHEGLPMGQIVRVRGHLADVKLSRALHNEDSLQIRGKQDFDLRYSGPEVAAGGIATLRLRPEIIAGKGDPVARLSDAMQLEKARAHAPAKIPVTMEAFFAEGQPMRLRMSDGESVIAVEGDVVQRAAKKAATAEDIQKQLEKLGDTPFCLQSPAKISLEDGLFLPVSSLNALRRNAAEELRRERIRAFGVREVGPGTVLEGKPKEPSADYGVDSLTVIFSRPELSRDLLEAGADNLWFQPESYCREALQKDLDALPEGTWLRLPAQCTESTLVEIRQVVEEYRQKLSGVVAESLGQLDFLPGMPVAVGTQFPVTNRAAVQLLSTTNAEAFVLWTEWNRTEHQPAAMPSLMKMYGREQLMLLNHCPARVEKNLNRGRSQCSICKEPSMTCGARNACLTDNRGYSFPMKRTACPEGCIISVLNALPTDLRDCDADRRQLGAGMLLHFTTETDAEVKNIVREFVALKDGREVAPVMGTTAGHWKRGVE